MERATVPDDRPGPRRLGYGGLLGAIVVLYILVIAAGDNPVFGPVRVLILGGVLIAATGLGGRRQGWIRAAVAGSAAALAVSIIAALLGNEELTIALTNAALGTLVLATIPVIFRSLVRRGKVDSHTVAGALATYLLLALLFSSVHQFLAATLGQPYLNGVDSAGDTPAFLYFSVVTLTTVGFGDITPASSGAQAVTVAEALTGQLYLVSVVAAVVGNWSPRRQSRSDDGDGEGPSAR